MKAERVPRKKYVNWVAVLYYEAKEGQRRVKDEMGENLVQRTVVNFGIKGDFDIPCQTIHSCVKFAQLEVLYSGVTSTISMVETALNVHIGGVWMVIWPLSVSHF